MEYTIPKTKKTLKACFSQASMEDSDHQSTHSAELIGSNDDLLTEILLRLPVTSILRFKSVSKHWRWLLSHTSFTLLYDKLLKSPGLFVRNTYIPFDVENPTTPPFLSYYFDSEKRNITPFRTLDYYFDRLSVRILQSCNGLLLCSTDRGPKGGRSLKYYVFNPTTKQLALIPPFPRRLKIPKSECFMALAFHQTACVHYKVVCIRSLKPRAKLFQVLLYSSDTKKWKISIQSFSAHGHWSRRGVYCNGAVYWVPSYCSLDIFYFKIDAEQLQKLPFPVELISSQVMESYIGESRGHLHLIAYETRQENRLRMNLYEMFSDHSGWFVKYQVELDALPGAFPDMISGYLSDYGYQFKVIDVVRGEEEEDTFIVLNTPIRIITYNVHDNSFKQISSLNYYIQDITSVHRYTETLSSF